MKRLIVCGLLAVMACPVLGQTADLQDALGGKNTPLTMKLKELNGDWRHVVITNADGMANITDMMGQIMPAIMVGAMSQKGGKKEDPAAAMAGMSMLGSMFGGGAKENVYYTKGQTLTVGNETFLVTYHFSPKKPDLMQMMMQGDQNGAKQPDFSKLAGEKLGAESQLSLTLMNLKTIGSMGSIRPFDLNQEIGGGAALSTSAKSAAPVAAKTQRAPQKARAAAKVTQREAIRTSPGTASAASVQRCRPVRECAPWSV